MSDADFAIRGAGVHLDTDELKQRTKAFALRIIRLVEALPNTSTARVIGNQLLRSGTSVGANYRAACRARSQAEFIAKIGIVEEEADESIYWLELLIEASVLPAVRVQNLLDEANELTAIFVASGRTAKARQTSHSSANPQSEIRNPKQVTLRGSKRGRMWLRDGSAARAQTHTSPELRASSPMSYSLVCAEHYERMERRFLKTHPDLLERYPRRWHCRSKTPFTPRCGCIRYKAG